MEQVKERAVEFIHLMQMLMYREYDKKLVWSKPV